MKCTFALESTTEATEIFGPTATATFVNCGDDVMLVPPRRNALIRLIVRLVSMINRANTFSRRIASTETTGGFRLDLMPDSRNELQRSNPSVAVPSAVENSSSQASPWKRASGNSSLVL